MAHSLIKAGADLNDHVPCDIDDCIHSSLECYSVLEYYSVLDLAILIETTEFVDVMLHTDAKKTRYSLDLAIKATTEKEDATSLCGLDADPRDANHFHLQSKRALILAAVRLGATSELDSLIKSMKGSGYLLDDCSGLTSAIEDCCRNGHYKSLKHLLEAGIIAKLDAAVFGHSVPLIIRHNQEKMLDLVLKNGADVNARDRGSWPTRPHPHPILLAIEKGNLELVRKLLRAGANVASTRTCKLTLCSWRAAPENMLVAAIATNKLPLIEEILQGCVDINGFGRPDNEYSYSVSLECLCCTPITVAIKKRNWELVDRLYRDDANINDAGRDPEIVRYLTPLSTAMHEKHYRLVKFLINAGATVNDRMALETAVDHEDLLELFIAELGTSKPLNKKCNALHFALLKAIRQNSIPKVKLILDSQLVDLSAL
ncbi:hypothetical protein GJ744_007398 [Endocarpon pusillum]|uniref:Uncharacterized protein n=1 Tax=Endocarpon pusillum TaxID=364733 RepID=A0A8H7AN04_9EURO|nr:hypothetical protein GJ744_007398 [Endocarpon pusillum]